MDIPGVVAAVTGMMCSFNEWLEHLAPIEKLGGFLFIALVWGFGSISSQLHDLGNKLYELSSGLNDVSREMGSLRDAMEDMRCKPDHPR